jgi:hypothetical protein
MAVTLQSMTGKGMNKPAKELNVPNKYNKLQSLENKRMKRKQAIHDAMNKIHDPDIA